VKHKHVAPSAAVSTFMKLKDRRFIYVEEQE